MLNSVVSMNFFFWNTLILYIYIYLEVFYSLIFFSIFRGIKFMSISISKRLNLFFFKGVFFSTYINLLLLYTLTLKLTCVSHNVLGLLFIYLFLNKCVESDDRISFTFLNFNIFFFFFLLFILTQ